MAAGEMNMPSSLSPYPEMIYAALDALNEQMGSNKTSISKFIESKYGNLPPGHSTLLRLHLNKMKESGELIFWKNNYMKPNPNFIRRGRGRPPKSSSKSPGSINGVGGGTPSSAPSLVLGSGHVKPRGRPRKYSSDQHVYDAVTVPLADVDDDEDNGVDGGNGGGGGEGGFVVNKSGRGRGRPPKLPKVDDNGVAASPPAAAASGRPRGRPPKVKAQTVTPAAEYDAGSSEW